MTIKWKLDDETKENKNVAPWVKEVCEELAKDITLACPGHTLVCSGGPYRNSDVETGYDVDKKELKVDFYSVIRLDGRQGEAIRYAKGNLKEACLTRRSLEQRPFARNTRFKVAMPMVNPIRRNVPDQPASS